MALRQRHDRKAASWLLILIINFFAATEASADVRVVGSSTILPIVKQAARIFTAETGILVHPRGGGSSAGVHGSLNRMAEIGMVSRALNPEEAKRLTALTIGWDGIAVIVNNRNPIQDISREQVIGVFSGKIQDWQDLGSCECKIVPVVKHQGRATRELFDRFFGLQEIKPPQQAHIIGSNAEAMVFVAADPMAIGYVSVGSVERAQALGARIKGLTLNGIATTMANVVSGTYPLTRPLNLIVQGKPNRQAQRFIDFMLSPRGQNVVREQGFHPVGEPANSQ